MYKNLYKNVNQLKEHQTERRIQLLEDQRKQREDQFSFQRDLKEILNSKHRRRGRNYFDESFKHVLMLSEWMMSQPEDIEDFFLVPCPKGKRCSLSTGDGRNKLAKLFYKNGVKFFEFRCNLPAYTIFDCVYNELSQSVYILDVIAFAGRDLVGCDAAFRFFWMKSKFEEDDIKTTGDDKNLQLKLLQHYDFLDHYAMKTCFQTYPMFDDDTELDGFLFYHKEGSYTAGETPLVLWLFPFMVDELFDTYRVNSSYHSLKPENYTNYLDFIKDFDEKLKSRQKKKHFNKKKVETEHDIMDLKESSFDDSRDEMQAMIDLEMTGNEF